MQLQLGEHSIDATDRTAIMAILNVSPDSPIAASVVDPSAALARALELRDQGAAIIDVGGHSTAAPAVEIEAQEEIDLSGEWTVEGLPFTDGGCQMTVAQAGTLLAGLAECLEFHFWGEIDATTGEFALTASVQSFLHMEFEGTASNDTLSMVNVGGDVLSPVVVQGARKSAAIERRNISGDWISRLSGVAELSRCDTSIWHRGEELEITLDCGIGTGGSFAGTINMESEMVVGSPK